MFLSKSLEANEFLTIFAPQHDNMRNRANNIKR